MATQAHCAYCFECLSASFDRRQPLGLRQIQDLWVEYSGKSAEEGTDADEDDEDDGQDAEMTDADIDDEPPARPAAISRLLNRTTSSRASSSSSLPSTKSSTSSDRTTSSGTATSATSQSSSRSSLFSSVTRHARPEFHPLFITWNTVSRSGYKSLRGCIGTFEPQELEQGLRSYALTSAFEDTRFDPIPASLLPSLQCCVTLLTNFSAPDKDPLNWTIGKHGLRISFVYHGRRYGATYLPQVAEEQGWTKEEALVSLMRKAGWSGRKDDWRRVQGLEIVRYEGKKVDLDYREWKAFKEWVEKKGVKAKPLN
ncbi:hypothetical protein M8818_005834 [Zalaria obscura]|uniref:Uncharacterized protein n=1 Tax=Zalaria obscura TaxID=2024903 RepID=A0ACC3SAV9_9PEZI